MNFFYFQADFDTQSDWFELEDGESVVKGEITIKEGKIILFATNKSLKLLADAKAFSSDGTFRVCPKIWKQLFVLCVEISEGVWVPVAYLVYPGKTYNIYVQGYTLVKIALDRLGLKLSASYMMADFEINIKKAAIFVFDITVKGCVFHYAKCIWKKVVDNGLKVQYQKKENEFLVDLVTAAIGLCYVPIERLDKAFQVLVKIAASLPKGKQYKFGKYLCNYLKKYWLDEDGPFPPSTWNYFNFRGVNTNNHQEGYNYKLNHRKELRAHPNPYTLANAIIEELGFAYDDATAAKVGNPNIKSSKTTVNAAKKATRRRYMQDLWEYRMDLDVFMKSIGNQVMLHDKRILSYIDDADHDKTKPDGDEILDMNTLEDLEQTGNETASGIELKNLRNANDFTKSFAEGLVNLSQVERSQLKAAPSTFRPSKKMTLAEGTIWAEERMSDAKLKLSPSQPETEGKNLFSIFFRRNLIS